MDGAAGEKEPALAGGVNASEDFYEGGFAGSIVAKQGYNLPGVNRKVNFAQGCDLAEMAGYTAHFHQWNREITNH